MSELTGEPGYSDIDFEKIAYIVEKSNELQESNEEIRDAVHSLGVLVNQLAQSTVNLKR